MGIHSLQSYIEQNLPTACLPVDITKIAHSIRPRVLLPGRPPHQPCLCLVVDAECCLDRLYGGYFSDWVCGGQWNRMVQFLAVLMQAVHNHNIQLTVFFNGALELERMNEWVAKQADTRKKINSVLRHVNTKGTPPPKIWWVAPVCLTTALRMALQHRGVKVMCSMDDHHQEVIAYCRENGYHGLMAEDAEYIIFEPPRYFSAKQLKLTYKSCLETKEFILNEVAKGLDLSPDHFCVFASLLGNHLLTEDDLSEFHRHLCPDVKGKPTQEQIIKAVLGYLRELPMLSDLDAFGTQVFSLGNVPQRLVQEHVQKFKQCVQYYVNGTKDGYLRYRPNQANNRHQGNAHLHQQHRQNRAANATGGGGDAKRETTPSNTEGSGDVGATSDGLEAVPRVPQNVSRNTTIPTIMGGGGAQLTQWPAIPPVSPEVERTASERHQNGLISPWVYQILMQGEIKMPVWIEEEVPAELPIGVLLFRPIRQMVYAILFNLYHLTYQAKQKSEQEQTKNGGEPSSSTSSRIPDILVREWVWTKYNPYKSPDIVRAMPLGWAVPTVQRLWFGTQVDDRKRRMRAFLTCMRSDTPLMLNSSYVRQHLLIMCTVLRYMVSQTELRVLRRQELHAFLAQAVSPQLMDTHAMQSLQLPMLSARGVQLAALFMHGVEMALLANDACGSPIPWFECCPWMFFDGKLFHYKLLKANAVKTLVEICDGSVEQACEVERMRIAILKGLKVEFARRPFPSNSTPNPNIPNNGGSAGSGANNQNLPVYMPPPPQPSCMGPPMGPPGPMMHPPPPGAMGGRGSGGRGGGVNRRGGMMSRGGQLEVAGVVVGSWGPNYGAGMRGNGSGRGLPLPPQVTSVGGGYRRGYSGFPMNPGPGMGRSYMGGYGPPRARAYPFRNIRRVNTSGPTATKKKVKKGGAKTQPKNGAGRGCTLETTDDQGTVRQVMSKKPSPGRKDSSSTDGQFDDAENPATNNPTDEPSSPNILKKAVPTAALSETDAPQTNGHLHADNE